MSRTTKIANIPRVPTNIDRGLAAFLGSIKESIEVARGRAGDSDSYVTKKELEGLGYQTTIPATTVASSSSSGSSTPTQATLGLHSVGTANIADRAVTAIKIAEGVIPGAAYILELIRNNAGSYLAVPVADIDAPVELAEYTSADGKMIIAYEIEANQDRYTLYAFDSANASGASSPYVVAGSAGFWVAIAGTHSSGIKSIVIDDDGWIGLGPAKGRIEFDDQATDEINFLDCNVGIGTMTPGSALQVVGMVRQSATWHAYGGFEDQAETVACGVGDWNLITNGANTLWNLDEADGLSEAADVFTLTNGGDYWGTLSLSISAINGKDFHVRVYNNTQTRVEGRAIGVSTTGAGNEMNVCLPIYIEGTAGDEFQFEIMSTDGTDPVVDDGLFIISYLHD